ncbi:MMPL family transporter, partial [Corynebacterium diphtheriae]|uniref:MMPL family transporter n=1 Tax=Corynebacterium diphtheriae TaxID=1717 RepID=UPI0012FFA2E8
RRTSRKATSLRSTAWYRIPAWAMKHSALVTVGIVAVLLGLTLPLAGVKFGGINETYLPPNNTVRTAQASFDENFPHFRTEPIKLVITGATNQQLVDVYQQANKVEGLTDRFKPSSATKDGTTVLSAGIENREDNAKVVEQLRAIDAPEGVSVYIGGIPAMEVESIEALFDKLPWMAIYIVTATFLLMSLVFGSMILPAKAIIMTILGLGSTLGILTAMFVDGVGSSLFNFSAGPLLFDATIIRMMLVPAVMHLLREDNWWGPAWLKKMQVSEGGSTEHDPLHHLTVDLDTAGRSGRTVKDDAELVPFSELMKRLSEES